VCNYGFFPNRKWDEFINDKDFEILKQERKINGTVYMYVLRNKKEKWIDLMRTECVRMYVHVVYVFLRILSLIYY